MVRKIQIFNKKITNTLVFQDKNSNAQALFLSSHRLWSRLASLLVLTSYVNQIGCQLLIVGGLSLVQPSPLRAMEPEDHPLQSISTSSPPAKSVRPLKSGKSLINSTRFYQDSEHPLTQTFWKGKDLSDRLNAIKEEIKNRKEEIVNCNSNSINITPEDLEKYKEILKCTECDPPLVQDLQDIKYEKKITSGWSGAEVDVLSFANGKIAIKKFKDIKVGLEELLYSLVALDINPAPQEIKMARIYDAVFCSDNSENCLSIVMEGAKGHDIDYFLSSDSSTNAVKACAEYLAMFHIKNYENLNENINKNKKNKYIDHISSFFNTLSHNPFKEEKEPFELLSLSIGKPLPDLEEVKSNNIIWLLSPEKQEQFVHFVKEARKKFEKNAGKIYRSLNTKKKGFYFLTVTHGDAHGNNFFYDGDKSLTHKGNSISEDSFRRVTMIDFASIVKTYGDIGDPAEDVGRFLASLWDWAAKQDGDLSKYYEKIGGLQAQFIDSYLQKIKTNNTIEQKNQKTFEKMFKENYNFYKLRYYKVIFNSKKDSDLAKDRAIKLKILNSWIAESFEESEHYPCSPFVNKGTIVEYLPDRPVGFIKSAAEGSKESYLTLLQEKLRHTGTATLSSSVTLAGMGGIGKTSLALEYAYLNKEDYKLIYWLLSETESSLLKGYRKLLQEIDVPIRDEDDESIIELVKQNIPKNGKCLLIYDNVPHPDFLKDKMPQHTDILITSRWSEGWEQPPLCLDIFRARESIEYLFKITGLEQTEENQTQAGHLAHALTHLPLALSHAANYIKLVGGGHVSADIFKRYLEDFKKDETINYFEECRNPLKEAESKITYENLIGKTLRMSMNLGRELISELAKKLMNYCAYFDPDAIPEEIFLGEIFLEGSENEKALQEAFAQLSSLSLIRAQTESLFSIHRLVQLVMRNEQESENRSGQSQILSNICQIFIDLFDINIYFDYQISQLLSYFPHILSVLEHSKRLNISCEEVDSLGWIGKILYLIEEDAGKENISILSQKNSILNYKNENSNKKLQKMLEKAKNLFIDSVKTEGFPDWLMQVADQSHPKIQNIIGFMYEEGLFVNKDYTQALLWYTKATEKGSTKAQTKAAEKDNLKAQTHIGVMYYNGLGVGQSYAEALKWYSKPAEQGDVNAQNSIGVIYADGRGVTRNWGEAFKWYFKAAEKGLAEAQYNLGGLYHRGWGAAQSNTEAFKWYFRAAEQGDGNAQYSLGVMYAKGQGVVQSNAEACKWYAKAAEKGHPEALYRLHLFETTGNFLY